jgi:phosphopantothenoylcysteine decarboxylase/phosphopantothenate--cysteine ligase
MDVSPPAGATVVRVNTASDLEAAVDRLRSDADVIVMAAAVADFRPDDVAEHKIKRNELGAEVSVQLTQNPDILRGLVVARGERSRPLIVGFAAETGDETRDVIALAQEKLARKGCDLLVVNDVSDGRAFGKPDNEVVILSRDGARVDVPLADKAVVSDAVWDAVGRLL